MFVVHLSLGRRRHRASSGSNEFSAEFNFFWGAEAKRDSDDLPPSGQLYMPPESHGFPFYCYVSIFTHSVSSCVLSILRRHHYHHLLRSTVDEGLSH